MRYARAVSALMLLSAASVPAFAQDACANRGQLDTIYCDANNDLVADTPADPAKHRDPSTIIFSYSPVENPAVYQQVYTPLLEHMSACTAKKFVYYPVQSNSSQIEAMRSGRLHISGYATGVVGFAVNMAGAVPFGAIASERGLSGYKVQAIVKADSPYKQLSDLKGKKVAHTAPSSNSGHLAPLVFFPEKGLVPNQDYKPLMSGGHDKSVLGVASGDYDMAPIASDVLDRMILRGVVKADQFRTIYESEIFPTSSFSLAHDLKPELAEKLRSCFFAYKFDDALKKEYVGQDRFLPMNYKDAWKPLRDIAEKSGTPYNKAAFEAEKKREAEAAARKAAASTAPPAPATPPKP
jgi:phosphonate transport system substrate-binding protein